MNLETLLAQGLNLVGAFTPRIALFLFLICQSVDFAVQCLHPFQALRKSGGFFPKLSRLISKPPCI